jgi:hypothetical protein
VKTQAVPRIRTNPVGMLRGSPALVANWLLYDDRNGRRACRAGDTVTVRCTVEQGLTNIRRFNEAGQSVQTSAAGLLFYDSNTGDLD